MSVWRPVPRAFRFRFKNSWLKEERCSEIVAECWQSNEGEELADKINKCAIRLKEWGDKMARRFKEKLGNCRKRMDQFRDRDDSFSVQCYHEAAKEYAKLLQQEEIF